MVVVDRCRFAATLIMHPGDGAAHCLPPYTYLKSFLFFGLFQTVARRRVRASRCQRVEFFAAGVAKITQGVQRVARHHRAQLRSKPKELPNYSNVDSIESPNRLRDRID